MGQKSPFVVCLGIFAGLPQPSRNVALYESSVHWVSAIQGPPLAVACSSHHSFFIPSHLQFLAFLTAHYLLPWYPQTVFASFFFDTALSQKIMPQGKQLTWPRNLCTSCK